MLGWVKIPKSSSVSRIDLLSGYNHPYHVFKQPQLWAGYLLPLLLWLAQPPLAHNSAAGSSKLCASVLKYWANLSAVSAVIPQRARTISLIRAGVTPMCLANRLLDKPKGSINSCFKISPGCTGFRTFDTL